MYTIVPVIILHKTKHNTIFYININLNGHSNIYLYPYLHPSIESLSWLQK